MHDTDFRPPAKLGKANDANLRQLGSNAVSDKDATKKSVENAHVAVQLISGEDIENLGGIAVFICGLANDVLGAVCHSIAGRLVPELQEDMLSCASTDGEEAGPGLNGSEASKRQLGICG